MLFTDGLYEIDGTDGVLFEMSQLHDAFAATGAFGDDMCLGGGDLTRLIPTRADARTSA